MRRVAVEKCGTRVAVSEAVALAVSLDDVHAVGEAYLGRCQLKV